MGSGMNYEHKATPLQAWCDALAFVEHTAKIIGNPKHFNPKNDFENQTLCQIMNLAHDAFQKITIANSIDARKEPDKASERLALQEFAIADVELLKSYLALAHRQYHVNAGKFWHWAGVKLGNLDRNLAAWHQSDLARYRQAAKAEVRSGDGLNKSLGGQLPLAVC